MGLNQGVDMDIHTLLNEVDSEKAFNNKYPILSLYIDLLEDIYYLVINTIRCLLSKQIKAFTVTSFIFQRINRNKKLYDLTYKHPFIGPRFGMSTKTLDTFYGEVISACALLSELDYDTADSLSKNKQLLSKYTKALNTLAKFILYDSVC
jgi:hypothetical protein